MLLSQRTKRRKHHNTCFNAERRCWGNFHSWCGCEGTDIWSIQEISAMDKVGSQETFRRDRWSLMPPSWNRWLRKTKHEGSIESYHSAGNCELRCTCGFESQAFRHWYNKWKYRHWFMLPSRVVVTQRSWARRLHRRGLKRVVRGSSELLFF